VNRGTKAMYEVLKRGRLHNLSVKCQLELLDSMGKPIILYGCEKLGDLEIAKHFSNIQFWYNHRYDKPYLFKISWIFLSTMKNDLL
jgi:hypothetical protein